MSDMLVALYALPKEESSANFSIRRALAPEKSIVLDWIGKHFGKGWANECDVAFSREPISCYLAIQKEELIGFACYDATLKNFFGPTGVQEASRGLGAGKALLLRALHGMKESGYGYGIIGGVGPATFYEKTVGATLIQDSSPGIYEGMLKR
ncbi:GNAT family N-acetyltransferase [Alkalihalobacillus sp. LMS6]|uniref:GNAT family N-acetyltransferase n=1 Tax=Alkalihalobacillus sp. LMS6 TaxID=2924034 RepID=UPI0020D05D80|nr:GNAT family N-acetyltransferase [Alkalihalobacillus sp. LMS6]UTR05861.1 GNAT family N-acetyltransferase [Alkalihalobacillus sp. LMS6]